MYNITVLVFQRVPSFMYYDKNLIDRFYKNINVK